MSDEIPTELRNLRDEIERWRVAHAKALTHAGELERQVKPLIEARDAARKTCDDLTDHCAAQGRRIADLERQRNRAEHRADTLAQWIIEDSEIDSCALDALIDKAGIDCPDCDGRGWVNGFRDIYSEAGGHSTREESEDCSRCTRGQVLR